ncbi:hypothetical protein [Methylobacterium oryzae]|uniref:hypothetical protein n=1 Tax=Methylobacterium oryzae TaxID=334852 RepID=UPI001F256004|nr:hypothetical protein [Methylobacterium oryzae]UIN37317.1 hypothetical protein LXM90_12775 [Methylobacterium oryzae]
MTERDPPRSVATDRTLRPRKGARLSEPAAAQSKTDEAPPQVRATNRIEWPGPLNEEERAALEAGWGFVE